MAEKKTPRLYKGRRNINVPLESLFKTVKSIAASGKEKEFLEKHAGLTVVAKPALVNAVKLHLAEHSDLTADLHAARIARSEPPPPGEPPSCFAVTKTG